MSQQRCSGPELHDVAGWRRPCAEKGSAVRTEQSSAGGTWPRPSALLQHLILDVDKPFRLVSRGIAVALRRPAHRRLAQHRPALPANFVQSEGR